MNKLELVTLVSLRSNVSRRVATDAIEAVFESIKHAVAKGERVSIPGFGTFEGRLRAPRAVANPQTGKRMTVPARAVPVFRPAADFRTRLGGKKRKSTATR